MGRQDSRTARNQEQSLRWPAASSVTIDLASCEHPSVLLPNEGERLDHQRGRSCLGTAATVSAGVGAALALVEKQNSAGPAPRRRPPDKPRVRRAGPAPVPVRRKSRDRATAVAGAGAGGPLAAECAVIDKSRWGSRSRARVVATPSAVADWALRLPVSTRGPRSLSPTGIRGRPARRTIAFVLAPVCGARVLRRRSARQKSDAAGRRGRVLIGQPGVASTGGGSRACGLSTVAG
jgi:hypothetical protein